MTSIHDSDQAHPRPPPRQAARSHPTAPLDGGATPTSANGGPATAAPHDAAQAPQRGELTFGRPVVFDVQDLDVCYGSARALAGVSLQIHRNLITAIIGPSGCGKSTFLRTLNRMNDPCPASGSGKVLYHGHDVYGSGVDRVEVRRRIGMVFQKPNPFPKSIYDNVAWAPRNLGMREGLDERVERALRAAALWDEVKDRLKASALGLSGGQQQRLCIARAIAIEPDVLLLDEPASALDPLATALIEELMQTLKGRYTIVIVTHNMQQAARVADRTAFFTLDVTDRGRQECSSRPVTPGDVHAAVRSANSDYVTGRFG